MAVLVCIPTNSVRGFPFLHTLSNISPFNEHPGLIFFRMDWLDLLAVQGTLKSLLQYHSSKASILCRSAFFIVQISHPHMTTGKMIALTRWIFAGKVMSLLLNMLSRFVIAFLPRRKNTLSFHFLLVNCPLLHNTVLEFLPSTAFYSNHCLTNQTPMELSLERIAGDLFNNWVFVCLFS